ncbi:hypothetical protein [Poseidonocella pacifica]|uniref:hypothetical protein n=1 Tax=Poseidonocella pacifica TaxID=871651 RepID=UPI00111412BC|nr:hypothetical protein [Poseidonocella pacifica]
MSETDIRPEHLGWVEIALRAANPDLPLLHISAQCHFGSAKRIAFVDIFGVEKDDTRRRQVRAEAHDTLRRLGYAIKIESGRDVYDIEPVRPVSAHDLMRMLGCLQAACEQEN